ncbi:hypothetical protein MOKP38_46640 [Mycobacterium avium subsp. hominissuis]
MARGTRFQNNSHESRCAATLDNDDCRSRAEHDATDRNRGETLRTTGIER